MLRQYICSANNLSLSRRGFAIDIDIDWWDVGPKLYDWDLLTIFYLCLCFLRLFSLCFEDSVKEITIQLIIRTFVFPKRDPEFTP